MWFRKITNYACVLIIICNLSTSSTDAFECGARKVNINEVINYGQPTSPGEWPWHVALYHIISDADTYACGGTLISETFVLTADHCVRENGHVLSINRIFIRLGLHNLRDLNRKTFQQHNVQRIHIYGESKNLRNDIALVELSTQAEFDDFVQPACLNPVEDLTRQFGTAVGWGLDETNKISQFLKSQTMPVVTTNECLEVNDGAFRPLLYSGNFCAGYTNGTTVCNGDSGGGLHFAFENVWVVGGIISFTAQREKGSNKCHTKSYAVFTNVQYYLPWIIEVTGFTIHENEDYEENENEEHEYDSEQTDSSDNVDSEDYEEKPTWKNEEHEYDSEQTDFSENMDGEDIEEKSTWENDSKQTENMDNPERVSVDQSDTYNYLLPEDCGKYLVNKIFGGTNANPREFPWMVQIIQIDQIIRKESPLCHGSIINKRYVLTSAYCILLVKNKRSYIRLGEYDRKQSQFVYAEIKAATIHAAYDVNTFRNNIGLVRLDRDVQFNDFVQPICLPTTELMRQQKLKVGIVTGWGELGLGQWGSAILQKAYVPVIGKNECRRSIRPELYIGDDAICTSGRRQPNACGWDQGTSFGYVFRYQNRIRFIQYGIVSVSGCEGGPTINTHIPYYMDWIWANLSP